MRNLKTITFIFAAMSIITASFTSLEADDQPVDSTVPTSGYNNSLEINSFSWRNQNDEELVAGDDLVPNQIYHLSMGIEDLDTVEDLQSLAFIFYYDTGDRLAAFSEALNADTTSSAGDYGVIKWARENTTGSALDTFNVDYDNTLALTHAGIGWQVIQSTAPALTDASGNTEGSIQYTFEVSVRISKSARFSDANKWFVGTHIIDGLVDNGSGPVSTTVAALNNASSDPLTAPAQGMNMNWYGEIEVPESASIDWVNASPGEAFSAANTSYSGLTFISNGYFDYSIFPSDQWEADQSLPSGVTFASLKAKEASQLVGQTQELAIKVADSDNLSQAVLLKPSDTGGLSQEVNIGSQVRTTEAGINQTMYFWVALSENFQNANYSGTLTFSILNSDDAVRSLTGSDSYDTLAQALSAGETDVQLVRPLSESLTIDEPMSIDFNGFTLTGDISVAMNDTAEITFGAIGTIDGNLTVNAPNLTLNNEVDVTGSTTIEAVANNTFNTSGTHTNGIDITGPGRILTTGSAVQTTITVQTDEPIILAGQSSKVTVESENAQITINSVVETLESNATDASITLNNNVSSVVINQRASIKINQPVNSLVASSNVNIDLDSAATLGNIATELGGALEISGATSTLAIPVTEMQASGERVSFKSPKMPENITFNGVQIVSFVSNSGIISFTPNAIKQSNTLKVFESSFSDNSLTFSPNVWNETQELGYDLIQDGIDAANSSDTIYVQPGIYNESRIDIPDSISNVTIKSSQKHQAVIKGIVHIKGEGSILDGFKISPEDDSVKLLEEQEVIGVFADDITVKNNLIGDFTFRFADEGSGVIDGDPQGNLNIIYVFNLYDTETPSLSNISLQGNTIQNIEFLENTNNTLGWASSYGQIVGIMVQEYISGVSIEGNLITNLSSAGYTNAINFTNTTGGVPRDIRIDNNTLSALTASLTPSISVGIIFGENVTSGRIITISNNAFTANIPSTNESIFLVDYSSSLDLLNVLEDNSLPINFAVEGNVISASKVINSTKNLGYSTIQSALDAAESGDEILVRPGIYEEDLTMVDGVILKGNNQGLSYDASRLEETIISGSTIVLRDNIMLDGLQFYNTYIDNSPHNNVTIQNSIIEHTEVLQPYIDMGLSSNGQRYLLKFQSDAQNITLKNLKLIGPGQNALATDAAFSTLVIPSESFIGGIDLNNVDNSTLDNIWIQDVSRYGVNISNDSQNLTLNSITIKDSNHVSSTFISAIAVFNSPSSITFDGDFLLDNVHLGFDVSQTSHTALTVGTTYDLTIEARDYPMWGSDDQLAQNLGMNWKYTIISEQNAAEIGYFTVNEITDESQYPKIYTIIDGSPEEITLSDEIDLNP